MAVTVDRSHRLAASEYFPEAQRKTGIAIHHTVCDSARKTLEIWSAEKASDGSVSHVATAFVIDYDGTIYEAFEPEAWAYQFGLHWPDEQRLPFEKRFIGIEITSDGGLTEHDGKLYAFDEISWLNQHHPNDTFDCGTPYRGYRYFERYLDEQLEVLGHLVDDLCTRFSIPRVYPEKPFLYYGSALSDFEGAIGHAMVRSDKSDPVPDPRLWKALSDLAGCKPVAIPAAVAATLPTPLDEDERMRLLIWNLTQIAELEEGAGSLVDDLIMELDRREVYLKLQKATPGAHSIAYTMAGGDRSQVAQLAKTLGFARVSEHTLEVHGQGGPDA